MYKFALALICLGIAMPTVAQISTVEEKAERRHILHLAPVLSKNAGTITTIRTGWDSDSFALITSEPIANPAHCRDPDGYASIRSLPGYSTYLAAALTAYVSQSPVVITIDAKECAGTRPKLIGLNLTK